MSTPDLRIAASILLRARLDASSGWPSFVASLERKAPLSCPFCGGPGEWTDASPWTKRSTPAGDDTPDRYYVEDGPTVQANQMGDVWQCRGRCGRATSRPRVAIVAGRSTAPRRVRACNYCGRRLGAGATCPECGRAAPMPLLVHDHGAGPSGRNSAEDMMIALLDRCAEGD